MKLRKLLEKVDFIESNVDFDGEILKITSDHRNVEEKSLFVAIKGTKRDAYVYIDEALKRGAKAVICENKEICKTNIPYILVENSRKALARVWTNYYCNPSQDITTIAITGTNGKTSSAYFLYNILKNSGKRCGLISTVECLVDGERIDINGGGSVTDVCSQMTTPDSEKLNYIYKKMKESNVKFVIIEASSHALEQNRLEGIEIDIGVFTNLSREHLDYHKDMEAYFKAKEKLFKMCKRCLINIDDPYGLRLMNSYEGKSYGYSAISQADYFATDIMLNESGATYDLNCSKGVKKIKLNVIALHNVYNSLAAIGSASLLGVDIEHIADGIEKTTYIKGRLERYKNKNIYIDYAHTPIAMKNVIDSVRAIWPQKRLVVLFGCGGDRDKGKRKEMGKISSQMADYTVITSDNSRNESKDDIIKEIICGVEKGSLYEIIADRREAIIKTAENLKENDVLLLLGKGHEEYEITGNKKVEFSEKKILDEVFEVDL